MTMQPSQGDLLPPQAGAPARAPADAPERCQLDYVCAAVKEVGALASRGANLMGFAQHALAQIPHEALRQRVSELTFAELRGTFVTSCARAMQAQAYNKPQCGRTAEVLMRAAELASRSVLEQWSLAPWHCLRAYTEGDRDALCAALSRAPSPAVNQMLAKAKPRNLFIAATPSDDLPTYIRRCQLIVNRVNPLYLVLDSDIVDPRADQAMQEVIAALGIPGFYISTRAKDGAHEATPLKMPEITGAAGAAYLRSDGATFDPHDAQRPTRASSKKVVSGPTAQQAGQLSSLASRPPATPAAAPTIAAPAAEAGAAAGSQRSRLDALRQRQSQAKAS